MRFFKKILSKNSRSEQDGIFFDDITKMIGFKPATICYYRRAFTHKSLSKTDLKGNPYNYERLEFLGDSVLGTIIADYLFQEVPGGDEGYLTKMRAKIVSRKHLNELGRELNLIQYLDKNETATHLSENVHGNMFEALVGAIYLDKGYFFCQKFIQKRVLIPYVDIKKLEGKITSYKSLIIEWCQKEKKQFNFEVSINNSDLRNVVFRVELIVDGQVIAKATASSKKAGEEKAATRGYYALQDKMT